MFDLAVGVDGDDGEIRPGQFEGHLEACAAGEREFTVGAFRTHRQHNGSNAAGDGGEQRNAFCAHGQTERDIFHQDPVDHPAIGGDRRSPHHEIRVGRVRTRSRTGRSRSGGGDQSNEGRFDVGHG